MNGHLFAPIGYNGRNRSDPGAASTARGPATNQEGLMTMRNATATAVAAHDGGMR